MSRDCEKCGQPLSARLRKKTNICSYCEHCHSAEASLRRRIQHNLQEELLKEETLQMPPEQLLNIVRKRMENSPMLDKPLREITEHKPRFELKERERRVRIPSAPLEPVPFDPKKLEKRYVTTMVVGGKNKPLIVIKYQKAFTAISGLLCFEKQDVIVGCELGIWEDEVAREQIRQLFGSGVVVSKDGTRSASEGKCDVGAGVELQRGCAEDPVRQGDAGRRDAEGRSYDLAGTFLDDAADPNSNRQDKQ